VTSSDATINCGADCSETYSAQTNVTLTATADSGSIFSGWSGGSCSGTGQCVVNVNQPRSVTANFRQSGTSDLNCGGAWSGTEENTTITAWPYRDCFRTNPVGTRTRMTNNTGAEVAWEQGTGWNGQNALRVRPPDGSLGRLQGYAGLGEHYFHAARTKRLNIRYLFRYNSNFIRYAQDTKWELAIKYDYTNPSAPVRREGCERAVMYATTDVQIASHRRMAPSQGVCSQMWNVPDLSTFTIGPGVRENEWISVESEFDIGTGWYRTYITTQDGVYNQALTSEIFIGMGAYGAQSETVPSPYWWGSIDCTAGCFWGWPDDGGGVVPRPVDTYIWYSHFVMSDNYIGPPAGFVQ
jgi:hypothetical protein